LAWASEADTLRGQLEATETRLRGLEQKLPEREPLQPPELAAEARPVEPVPSEPSPSEANPADPEVSAPNTSAEVQRSAEGIAELARRGIGEFGRVLASADVNVASLFSQFGMNHAEGGPFVPPPRGDQSAGGIVPDGLVTIRSLAKALSLSSPLEHYQVGSRFGPRRDPFNGRPAYHTGLDFDAAYMSPVYATAAGIVTYAGYRVLTARSSRSTTATELPLSTATCIVTPSRWAKGPSREHWPRLGSPRTLRGDCERTTAGSREVHGTRTSRSDSRKVTLGDAPYAAEAYRARSLANEKAELRPT
jgi:hypothetical protein